MFLLFQWKSSNLREQPRNTQRFFPSCLVFILKLHFFPLLVSRYCEGRAWPSVFNRVPHCSFLVFWTPISIAKAECGLCPEVSWLLRGKVYPWISHIPFLLVCVSGKHDLEFLNIFYNSLRLLSSIKFFFFSFRSAWKMKAKYSVTKHHVLYLTQVGRVNLRQS